MSDEEAGAEGEEQEAPQYRLVAVRHAPLPTAKDLTPTLGWLVEKLQDENPALFRLSARTPAMRTVPVLDGNESHVEALLEVSEIVWHFGRDPEDPTHRVVFFNDEEGSRNVLLRVSFVANGVESTGPGLVVELILGDDAAGPRDKYRALSLDKLFTHLVAAIHPDFGHIEIPGHPDPIRRPAEYQVGWITYLAHGEATIPALLPDPAVALRDERGTKILATQRLAMERYEDIAKEIEAVRDALHPPELIEPEPDDAVPVPVVQTASYMGARRAGQFDIADEDTETGSARQHVTLPFAPLPEEAPSSAPAPGSRRPATSPGVAAPPQTSGMPFKPSNAPPTFGLPPPPAAPMPPPPEPGPRRAQTLVIPPSSPDAPKTPDSKPWGLPFKSDDPNKDPKKGG